MNLDKKKEILEEYFDSVKDKNVKAFMEQCVETIPDYWFQVPASSGGKYHPNYAKGYGGLVRHTIALLRFFNRIMRNTLLFGDNFTEREQDLLRVACLMHDSRKSGSDEDYAKNKYTRDKHPLLAAKIVRNINSNYITAAEKELIATAIESHMGQWNTIKGSKEFLPLPTSKYQKIVSFVDYLAATQGLEMEFDNKQQKVTKDSYIFDFGKYRGKTLTEVINKDPAYIKWAKTKNDFREPLNSLLKQIK